MNSVSDVKMITYMHLRGSRLVDVGAGLNTFREEGHETVYLCSQYSISKTDDERHAGSDNFVSHMYAPVTCNYRQALFSIVVWAHLELGYISNGNSR